MWNEELEDKLVDLWEENECLYRVSAGSYRDRQKKRNAIEKIATTIGLTGML